MKMDDQIKLANLRQSVINAVYNTIPKQLDLLTQIALSLGDDATAEEIANKNNEINKLIDKIRNKVNDSLFQCICP